jgi:RNA 2',3'-cyclic 3'-phosphodiesterase
MRLFIAIELPDEIRRSLRHVQDAVRSCIERTWDAQGTKWVRPEQMHVTLKFLGETADEAIPGLTKRLGEIKFGPLRMATKSVQCFPPHGPIRVIAAELDDPEGLSADLQAKIDEACHTAGFRLEGRKWVPHITLGRVKERLPGSAREMVMKQNVTREFFVVDQFSLIESRLDREGPQYVTVARFPR